MSDDDLIRRGDVRRGFRDYSPDAGDDFHATLDALPADPRAAAAARLAEAISDRERQWYSSPASYAEALAAWRNLAKPEVPKNADVERDGSWETTDNVPGTLRNAAESVRALPADPRAAAAVRLAEAADELVRADDEASRCIRENDRIAFGRGGKSKLLRARITLREAVAAWRTLAPPEPAPEANCE